MVFQTIERWRSARNWSFGFAAAAFLVAFGVRYGLNDWLPEGLPFLTFFPAVIVTAFFAGLWPGVLVTILSTLTAWYFFLRPVHTFTLDPAEVLALVFFVAIAGISIALIEAFHVAVDRLQQERERAERLAEQRETMFAELQHRISNNLQLVAALLRLEHAQISDSRAKKALAEASRRLALIGTLHRHLYDGTGSQVDFGIFLKRLGNEVLQTWDARSVELLVQSERMILPPEQSIPIALIVAELMSNALEHGLAGRILTSA
jgi:hypothetical protein